MKLVDLKKPEGRNWFPQNVLELDDSTDIFVYDVIGWDVTAKSFIEQMNAVETRNFRVRVNTPGGYMDDGFAIFNHMVDIGRQGRIITTLNDSWAASMGSIIMMGGSKVQVRDTSIFMVHKPLVGMMGNADDLRSEADVLDKLENLAIIAYKRHTDLSEDKIREMLREETFLTGQEAVDMGFAHELISSKDDEVDPVNLSAFNFTAELAEKIMVAGCPVNWATIDEKGSTKRQAEYSGKIKSFMAKAKPPVAQKTKDKQGVEPQKPNNGGSKMYKLDEQGNLVDEKGKVIMTSAEIAAKNIDPTLAAAHQKEIDEAKKEATVQAKAEAKKRISEIAALGKQMSISADVIESAIAGDKEIDEVRVEFINAHFESQGSAANGIGNNIHVATGVDEVDKLKEGLTTSILCRGGIISRNDKRADENRKSEFANFSGQQVVKEILQRAGYPRANNMISADVGRAYTELMSGSWRPQAVTGIDSQTLQSVLTDSVNAAMMKGVETARVAYPILTVPGDLNDLKVGERYDLSEAADIKEVKEGQVAEDSQIDDQKETMQLTKWMRTFSYTEEAVINDRLGALTDMPMKFGRSIERKKESKFFTQILSTDGPTLDRLSGSAFFSSANKNVVTPATISKSTLSSAVKLMFAQTHFSPDKGRSEDIYMTVPPRYLVTGPNLMVEATDITANVFEPNVAQNEQTKNVFGPGGKWAMEAIASPWFASVPGAENFWFVQADPSDMNACVVYTLAGRSAPEVTSKVGQAGEVQGTTFQIKHWFVVKFLDYRPYVRCAYTGA